MKTQRKRKKTGMIIKRQDSVVKVDNKSNSILLKQTNKLWDKSFLEGSPIHFFHL